MFNLNDSILSEFTENVTPLGYVYGRSVLRDYSVQSEAERAAKMAYMWQVAAKIPWREYEL